MKSAASRTISVRRVLDKSSVVLQGENTVGAFSSLSRAPCLFAISFCMENSALWSACSMMPDFLLLLVDDIGEHHDGVGRPQLLTKGAQGRQP